MSTIPASSNTADSMPCPALNPFFITVATTREVV